MPFQRIGFSKCVTKISQITHTLVLKSVNFQFKAKINVRKIKTYHFLVIEISKNKVPKMSDGMAREF